ncbi:isopentenyl-diphosphate Delta-isomerase [bacterium]|nr:isopentenyl-diphosphate Delta-isomerase [bacterium]
MSDATRWRRRRVVLCDDAGTPVGSGDLLAAHQGGGLLHKAFSIVVFRNGGREVLLQQRSRLKPLFALRWANTCCSHPRPGGAGLERAAGARLQEELGFTVALREAGSFVYRATDPDTGFSEYEHDTVLVGSAAGDVLLRPDPAEIADWRWQPVAALQRDLRERPDAYAPWLPEVLRLAVASAPAR